MVFTGARRCNKGLAGMVVALLLGLGSPPSIAQKEEKGDKKKEAEAFKIKRITQGMGLQSVGPVSPDGRRALLIAKKPEQNPNLYVMELGDHSIRPPLTSFAWGAADPAWSPDGNSVAVAGFSETASFSDIYLLDIGTGRLRQITRNNFSDNQPVFSPDGKRLFFTSDESPLPDAAFGILHVAALEIGKNKSEWFTEDEVSSSRPLISPDGNGILLVKIEEDSGRHSLWQYGFDGKPLRNLTGARFARIYKYITKGPSGSFVLWAQEQPEQQESVYLFNPKTGEVQDLPDPDTPKSNPTVSPDGKLIAYISPAPRGVQLFLYDSATGQVQSLTAKGRAFSPLFISNTSLFVGSDRDKENELYLIDLAAPAPEKEKK
jgi:Tol biopolymer transport system component